MCVRMCIPNSSLNRGTPKRKPSDIYRNASRLHFSIYIHTHTHTHTHTHISQLTSAPARDSPAGHSKTDSADCNSVAEGDETTTLVHWCSQRRHHITAGKDKTHTCTQHIDISYPLLCYKHTYICCTLLI